ncbi:MAG: hypothetical protein OXU96_03755 [Gammaproteobacteria bacterium]|nr:hypothetical protein [Gammaproteobacteria bacterium]
MTLRRILSAACAMLLATTAAAQSAFDRADPGYQPPAASQDASHCISWDKKPSRFFGGRLTNECAQPVSVHFHFHPPGTNRPPLGVGAPYTYQRHRPGAVTIQANSGKQLGAHYPNDEYEFDDAFDGAMRGSIILSWAACFGEYNFAKYDGGDGYHCQNKQRRQQNAAAQSAFDRADPGLQSPDATAAQSAFDRAGERDLTGEMAEWKAAERRRIAREKAEREERERIARIEAEREAERQRLAAEREWKRREQERIARIEAEREWQREQDSGNAFTRGLEAFTRGLGGGYSLDNTLRQVQDITRRAHEENDRRARENGPANARALYGCPQCDLRGRQLGY